MKILTTELKNKLKLLKPALDTKAQLPALQGVLLRDNTLTAYNLETALTARLDTDTKETFIIPSKAVDIIQSVTDDYIELLYEDRHLLITFGKSKSKYQTIDVTEYPEIPTLNNDAAKTEINASCLIESMKKCMYAIAVDETTPVLTGLLFNAENNVLNLVGCDGCRLALASMEYDKELKFIVPKRTLSLLQSFSIQKEDTVSITSTNKHIIFSINEYCIISRLLEGNFPDYKTAIPNHEIVFEVNRCAMLEIFSRINLLLAGQNSSPAKITFQKDEIHAEITVPNSEYIDTIEAKSNLTEPITIGVNSHYMADCLRSFSADNITIHIGTPITPMLITADNQTALVLPVRLKTQ